MATPTQTPQISTWDLIKALGSVPAEAKSAGAGLAATQQMVNGPQQPLVPAHIQAPQVYPQDLLAPQRGPYGSSPGEVRLDMTGEPISGFAGIKRKAGK